MANKSIPQLLPVSNYVSDETVETLEYLLGRARAGEVVGIAYCAMFRRRRYSVDLVGEARNDSTFTRGMVAALDEEASEQVAEDAGPETVF